LKPVRWSKLRPLICYATLGYIMVYMVYTFVLFLFTHYVFDTSDLFTLFSFIYFRFLPGQKTDIMFIKPSSKVPWKFILMAAWFVFMVPCSSGAKLCRSVGWLGCIDYGCSNIGGGSCQNLGDRPRNNCVCVLQFRWRKWRI